MNKSAFRQRYENWKNGLKVYDAGKVIEKPNSPEEKQHEDAALRAALEYALAVKLDKFDSGKDAVAGGYNFNAIKQVSDEAPLSYGSYYDLTGDVTFDGRLHKYNDGKTRLPVYNSGPDLTAKYEGFSDTVYQKKGDVPTVGYGTTDKKWIDYARKRGRITEAEGRKAMMEHFNDSVIPQLQKNIPYYDELPEKAQWVLQDILYNVGSGNLFNKSPNFMRSLKSRNYKDSVNHMDWDNNKPGFSGAKKRNAERIRLWNEAFADYEKNLNALNAVEAEQTFNEKMAQEQAKTAIRDNTYVQPPTIESQIIPEQLPYIGRYWQGDRDLNLPLRGEVYQLIKKYSNYWNDYKPILFQPTR